jgi:hypothetical protein
LIAPNCARIRCIARLNRYRRLMAERARFARVIELSPNGLLLFDTAGTIHLANSAMWRMLMHSRRLLQHLE